MDTLLVERMAVFFVDVGFSRKGSINTLLYADNKIIMGRFENDFQGSIYTLHTIQQ